MRIHKYLNVFTPSKNTPLIEHLHGGDYNRITAITLPKSYGNLHSELILRVPRDDDSRPDRIVVLLGFLRQATSIPVPFVVATDFSNENPLERPYILQQRIPGTDLNVIWDTLNHSQKCIVAKDLGIAVRKLLALESQYAGIVDVATDKSQAAREPNIVPFELRGLEMEMNVIEAKRTDSKSPRGPQTTLELFESLIKRWRSGDLDRAGEDSYAVKLWDRMSDIVREMDDMELFESNLNCLCHVDLHSRNVMVRVDSNQSLEVTAILDWDEAVFAPKFMNCDPPRWLWDDTKYQVDEDGLIPWPYELSGARNAPSDPDKQELKRIFEEQAGPEYCDLAYKDHHRLCRGLFRVAMLGLDDSMHYKALERISKEWNSIRSGLMKGH